MYDLFLAHILVFLLVAIPCSRVLFIQEARIDTLSILPFFGFLASILTFLIWEVDPWTIFGMVIALFSFIANIRPMFRLFARVYVDGYKPFFIFVSVILLIISTAALVTVVYFRPVRFEKENISEMNVTEKIVSHRDNDYVVFESSDTTDSTERKIILFVPSTNARVVDYEFYFATLAEKGWTIITGNFYSKEKGFFESKIFDLQKFRYWWAICNYFFNKEKFASCSYRYDYIFAKFYEELYYDAAEIFGLHNNFYVITDGISKATTTMLFEKLDEKVTAYFALDTIPEYKTSTFGFVEQSNPIVATKLGESRDKTFFIPRYCAIKTDDFFNFK